MMAENPPKAAVVFGLLVGIGVVVFTWEPESQPLAVQIEETRPSYGQVTTDAMTACGRFVRAQFHYEASENWTGGGIEVSPDNSLVIVESVYTAQNGFGSERQINTYCQWSTGNGVHLVIIDGQVVLEL